MYVKFKKKKEIDELVLYFVLFPSALLCNLCMSFSFSHSLLDCFVNSKGYQMLYKWNYVNALKRWLLHSVQSVFICGFCFFFLFFSFLFFTSYVYCGRDMLSTFNMMIVYCNLSSEICKLRLTMSWSMPINLPSVFIEQLFYFIDSNVRDSLTVLFEIVASNLIRFCLITKINERKKDWMSSTNIGYLITFEFFFQKSFFWTLPQSFRQSFCWLLCILNSSSITWFISKISCCDFNILTQA